MEWPHLVDSERKSLLGDDLCDVGKGENAHVVCLRLKA